MEREETKRNFLLFTTNEKLPGVSHGVYFPRQNILRVNPPVGLLRLSMKDSCLENRQSKEKEILNIFERNLCP